MTADHVVPCEPGVQTVTVEQLRAGQALEWLLARAEPSEWTVRLSRFHALWDLHRAGVGPNQSSRPTRGVNAPVVVTAPHSRMLLAEAVVLGGPDGRLEEQAA